MSQEQSSPSGFAGKSNAIPFLPVHKTGRRIAVLLIAVALISVAAAAGMRSDSADNQAGPVLQPAPIAGVPGTEFVYFPSQYVNQATEPSEHVPAF